MQVRLRTCDLALSRISHINEAQCLFLRLIVFQSEQYQNQTRRFIVLILVNQNLRLIYIYINGRGIFILIMPQSMERTEPLISICYCWEMNQMANFLMYTYSHWYGIESATELQVRGFFFIKSLLILSSSNSTGSSTKS